MTLIAFSQQSYRKVVDALDEVTYLLMNDHGYTEEEAEKFMLDFIKSHYFPVWLAMNPPHANTGGE